MQSAVHQKKDEEEEREKSHLGGVVNEVNESFLRLFFSFWVEWQIGKTSYKITCGRQCDICVENALT